MIKRRELLRNMLAAVAAAPVMAYARHLPDDPEPLTEAANEAIAEQKVNTGGFQFFVNGHQVKHPISFSSSRRQSYISVTSFDDDFHQYPTLGDFGEVEFEAYHDANDAGIESLRLAQVAGDPVQLDAVVDGTKFSVTAYPCRFDMDVSPYESIKILAVLRVTGEVTVQGI